MTGVTIRRTLAMFVAAIALAIASPAFAQTGQVRGVITDAQDKPVDGAKIVIQNTDTGASPMTTKSNKKGEFMQVGLTPGHYKITASKGDLTVTQDVQVRLETATVDLKLVPAAAKANAAGAAAQQAFSEGVTLSSQPGHEDEAIAKFQGVATQIPNCVPCYTNIGTLEGRQKKYEDAEAAFKKAVDLFENADAAFKGNAQNVSSAANAYTGLANVYNAEKKFDLAVEAQKKASDLESSGTGPAGAGAAGGAAPAGNANALFNQGIILWNANKIPEAKAQFEQALKLDPTLAEAHYWLGMALVNTGDTAGAKPHFEQYLKLAPTGQYADTAKAILAQIK